jgi:hypothetical protein
MASTISKESKTSPSAKMPTTTRRRISSDGLCDRPGEGAEKPLHDPNNKNAPVADNAHPKAGNVCWERT